MEVDVIAAATPDEIVLLLDLSGFTGKNFTQQSRTTSAKKSKVPITVEKAHASSMCRCIRSCGDSFTEFRLWTLLTASIFGKMQVLTMRANRWTATSTVVQALKAMRRAGGYG